MKPELHALICVALPEEAKFLKPGFHSRTLVTGMGRAAAAAAIERGLEATSPGLVVTAGFAGALSPELPLHSLLHNADAPESFIPALQAAGSAPVTFHCSERVLVTAAEKAAAWKNHGRHAVEMESEVIHQACRERNIPCVTLRVISDTAHEDLPMDFNQFATAEGKTHFPKLLAHIALRPQLIPKLLVLSRQTTQAARILGAGIERFLSVIGETKKPQANPRLS